MAKSDRHQVSGKVESLRRKVAELESAERQRSVAEAALRESEQRYRTLVETSPDAITVTDLGGQIIMANRRAVEMNGCTAPEELLGKNAFDFIAKEDRERATANMMLALERGAVRNIEYTLLTRDGRAFPVELSASPLLDAEGKPYAFLGVVRDISIRNQLQTQLRQAQKMEAIGRLAGGVAHDFNNLLFVVLNYAQWIRESLGPQNKLFAAAEQIEKAAQHGAALARQLLAFSRRGVARPEVLDLNQVVRELEGMLRPLLGEDIELRISPAVHTTPVRLDRGHLEQVLMNLAVNARDAMPGGGRLAIEVAEVELDEEFSRTHLGVRAGAYASLTVSDTGCGMTAEVCEHVFEPFFTTKHEGQGTGLGLSTVYGIVKQAGGHIWFYSELNVGTTFKIYLPWEEGAVATDAGKLREARPGPATETVLLVEDEPTVREITRQILEGHGYKVLAAGNGREALQLLDQDRPAVNLLLTDVIMPDMNGQQLAEKLIQLRPGIRVLYMSGYTNEVISHHGLLQPGVACIQKPFVREELLRTIRDVLTRGD